MGGGAGPSSPAGSSRTVRSRSLRKSAAVEEEVDPLRDLNELNGASMLHGVPRLLLPSLPPTDLSTPTTIHQLALPNGVPHLSVDTNHLSVPSPASAYKLSPDSSRQASLEMPTSADLLSTMSFAPSAVMSLLGRSGGGLGGLLGQLHEKKMQDCGETEESISPNTSFDHPALTPLPLRDSKDFLLQSTSTDSATSSTFNKSIIQEDVKRSNGRYQLIRKKGRSEVWNLFGQVVDTYTNQRLPFVACYACKVLYTDTGGGTGNMTRHRCPSGASFRSFPGSSTDTMMQTSFDSCTSGRRRSASPEVKKMHLSNVAPTSQSLEEATSGLSPSATNHSESAESLCEEEKSGVNEAALRCAAYDLLHPAIFSSRGFRGLVGQLLKVGKKRSCSQLFPDPTTMCQTIEYMAKVSRTELLNEIKEETEATLSVEKILLHGERYVVNYHRIREDWRSITTVMAVYPCEEVGGWAGAVDRALKDYMVEEEKIVRVVVPHGTPVSRRNTRVFPDVVHEITQLVCEALESSSVSTIISSLESLTDTFASHDLLPFITHDWSDLNKVTRYFRMVNGWKTYHRSIRESATSLSHGALPIAFEQMQWDVVEELAVLLEAFHETIEALAVARPSMPKAIPEWIALSHEYETFDASRPLAEVKRKIASLLRERGDRLFSMEYRIAALLNPRLSRKLNMLFGDTDREEVFRAVRDMCGMSRKGSSSSSTDCEGKGETRRKKMFLSSLEDSTGDDELEAYLRGQFSSVATSDVYHFWKTVGSSQFPQLARLARRILVIPATSPTTDIDRRVACLSSDQVESLLVLRSTFDNSFDDHSFSS